MPTIIEITDFSLPGLDPYARLTEAQLKNKRNPEQALFIAESGTVIGHALDAGYEPVSMLMEKKHIGGQTKDLIVRCGDIPIYTGAREVLSALTGYALTRGILCAMRRPREKTVEEVLHGAARVAVLEGIVDPTNLGAIIRSAAALGMDGVLLSPTCCDPLSRRAVRVSMGTVFQIPWARIPGDHTQWPLPGLELLRQRGFATAAMALTGDSVPIDDPNLMAEEKLAIILGTEGDGLMAETIRQSDYTVLIPMFHGVDSLNVAAASAVAFWQLGRHNDPEKEVFL